MTTTADVNVPFGSSDGTIQDDKVLKKHVGEQLLKAALVAGGAAGNHTVTGIATADTLVMVLHYTTSATLADLTSEFTISATNTINNTGGTATTGDQLVVFYQDNT